MVYLASVNGIEMEYTRFGQGSKIFVILPGLSLKSVMLSADAVASAYSMFASDYTVYLFDRRKNLPDSYSIAEMADDTAAVMQFLGISDAYVFGASQGGMIGLSLAVSHPSLVKKLIVGSSAADLNAKAESVVQHWITLAEQHQCDALIEDTVNKIYAPATVSQYGEMLKAGSSPLTDAELSRFLTLAKGCAGFNLLPQLHTVRCTVLVLGCEGDKVLSADASRRIADALHCESFFYGEEFGHGVYDEAPDYKSRILSFFEA